jgi:hypothetical protein
LGLDETLRVEPFREFDVPVLSRVYKAVDAFVEKKWYAKVFSIFWEMVGIFQR